MKAGAVDFLAKPFDDNEMLDAVRAAIARDRDRREEEGRQADLLARHASLTPREREVMALITQGLLNKQVAWELGLSEIMIKIHRGAAMRKMRAGSLIELVRMAETLRVAAPELLAVARPVADSAGEQ